MIQLGGTGLDTLLVVGCVRSPSGRPDFPPQGRANESSVAVGNSMPVGRLVMNMKEPLRKPTIVFVAGLLIACQATASAPGQNGAASGAGGGASVGAAGALAGGGAAAGSVPLS